MTCSAVRIAVVGLGKIARDQHLAAITANPELALAATVDPERAGLAGVPHFKNLDHLLLDGPDFDAIALCTPPQVRFTLAAQALREGKHVLLEKPPGATPPEVMALEEIAQAEGLSLFTSWHSRFAGGVEPAKSWLAYRRIEHVDIIWREDVRVWHPGQSWIWQPGGLGVFDPGINALSILTHIIPGPFRLKRALLCVPSNVPMPIAATLDLEGENGVPVSADFDFRQAGEQRWDISFETDAGALRLSSGGADLFLPNKNWHFEDREYAGLYARFAELVRTGGSEVDIAPLQLVREALLRSEKKVVMAFNDD